MFTIMLAVLALFGLVWLLWHWRVLVKSVKTHIDLYEARYGDGDHWREKLRGKNANH